MSTVMQFRMPSLGADMESGVLLEWLVHQGDTVHKGDVVAVVDTAKAAVEVECFASGVVQELLVEPGTRVPVGEVLATIATSAEPAVSEPVPLERAAPQPVSPQRAAPEPATPGVITSPLVRRLAEELHIDLNTLPGTGDGGRITHADVVRRARPAPPNAKPRPQPPRVAVRPKASPLAKRLAAELGVDLAGRIGSGPGGALTAADIRRAAAAAVPPPPTSDTAAAKAAGGRPQGIDTQAMRATIGGLMSRSKREIPHYYLTDQIDLGHAMEWLRERNRQLSVTDRLVPAALLLKAAALAAAEVKELNGFWIDGGFAAQNAVHLGVAISLRGGGLVAPAIHDADKLALIDLMAALKDLVARTRAGRLRGSELADPTITVSNLGDQGVESILGVIYPPQVALVGFGRIVERPWAVDGLLGIRPVVTVSLAADHRVTDGATGARYLRRIAQHLGQPEDL